MRDDTVSVIDGHRKIFNVCQQTNKMVRSYERKGKKPSWSKESLYKAVESVKSGTLSGYKAAIIFNIPRKTIMDHVTGRRGQKSSTQGRPTALATEVELQLASCLHVMEKHGFGLSRKEILDLVGDYVKNNNLSTCFTNNVPGKDWLSNFMSRHNLSIKKPQAVEIVRKKAADPFIIQKFYDIVEKVIKDLGLENKPERIFNIDETSYCSDPKKTKVVGLKGFPSTRVTNSAGKCNTTVLFASNAAGGKGPPFIIYKGKYVWSEWTSECAYPGTLYAATINGWIESGAFEEFIVKCFIPMVQNKDDPTLLIYDGHSTHVRLSVIEKAKENNITIIKLPAHTSHLLQPLDLSVFKPYKDAWDQEIVKWQRTHQGQKIPKKQFSELVGKVWKNLDPNVIKSGFRKSGIYPFNRNAVPEHKLDPEALKRWKKYNAKLSNAQILTCSPLSLITLCLNKINSHFKLIPINLNNVSVVNSNTSKQSSFEDLLLESMKQSETNTNMRKRNVRISGNAEVLTHEDVIKRLKQKEDYKTNKEKEKEDRRKLKENKRKLDNPSSTKVHLLNENLRRDNQNSPFLAVNDTDLPVSLQKTKKSKVVILSNVKLEPKLDINNIKVVKARSGKNLTTKSALKMRLFKNDGSTKIRDILLHTDEKENVEPDVPFGFSDIQYFTGNRNDLKEGDWVIVKFTTKKSIKHFVGQILFLKDNIPTVKFMRKVKSMQVGEKFTFSYPCVEDICEIHHLDDVIVVLPQPIVTRRGQVIFDTDFSNYNIQ